MKLCKLPALLIIFMLSITTRVALAQNWTTANLPKAYWSSVASSADGVKQIAVAGLGRIYCSTNSGALWTETTAPFADWTSVCSSFDGTKLCAVADDEFAPTYPSAIYTSTNGGQEWSQGAAPIETWDSVASSADGTKLVASVFGEAIYTSTNSGIDWISNSAPSLTCQSVASSADGTKLTAVAQGNGIYTSSDGGNTWAQATNVPVEYWYSVASSADGTKLIVASLGLPDSNLPGSVYTSTDAGKNWNSNSLPGEAWHCVASSADGTRLVALTGAGLIFTSTNSGTTWSSSVVSNAYWISAVLSADGSKVSATDAENETVWTSQIPPAPLLKLEPINGSLFFSWILPSTNFSLQEYSSLTATRWNSVTSLPVLNLSNLQNEVTLPMTSSSAFYRLSSP